MICFILMSLEFSAKVVDILDTYRKSMSAIKWLQAGAFISLSAEQICHCRGHKHIT